MKFSDIPGQKEIIGRLISSVRYERVSHAQLFTGPEGCGSLALALAYAQYVSCENRSQRDSCGICKSCVKYEKMIHPDLHFVFPVIRDKKPNEPVSDKYIEQWREIVKVSPYFSLTTWLDTIEAGNAQGLIFASEAAEILRKLSLKSFESDFKVMIIWLPEKMHQATANKLLKLIEEPPEKTLFLLVSEEPDKVVQTILSRCQLIKIPSFKNEDVSGYLLERFRIHKAKADDISMVSNGNIIRAIELCENEDSSLLNLERFKNLMRFAWKRDIISIVSWSEDIASIGREPQKSFLAFSLRIIRENLMLTLDQMKNRLVFMTGDEAGFSSKFHPFINQENICPLADELNLAHAHIEANGNAKIVFLDLALKITRLISR
ncbi:MAG TPA: DNA polymerase III subunit delta [Bacteroidales bacterium]|nr:DNA polymerase III subunit delta [Bacteroidales bacterium]HBZ21827.1 DNA polymerase III subunit delta [Bacteroidales bacterium]